MSLSCLSLLSEAVVVILAIGEDGGSTYGMLHASRLCITLRIMLLLFPSNTTNFNGANFPGLLLLADISVYFLLASLRAYINRNFSYSSSACIFGSFLGGNLFKNLRSSSF